MKLLIVGALAFNFSAYASLPVTGYEDLEVPEVNLEALEQAFNLDNSRDAMWDAGACSKIQLTETQKAALKTAFIGNKKAQIQGKADLEIAGLDYLVALTDSAGTKQAADTASSAVSQAVAKIANNHMGLANEILFSILEADQRRPALMCMHAIHKHMAAAKLKKMCKKLEKP